VHNRFPGWAQNKLDVVLTIHHSNTPACWSLPLRIFQCLSIGTPKTSTPRNHTRILLRVTNNVHYYNNINNVQCLPVCVIIIIIIITKTVPALNSVSSFVIIVSLINVTTLGSLFRNIQVVLSKVEFMVSTGFAEIYCQYTSALKYKLMTTYCNSTTCQSSCRPRTVYATWPFRL